MFLIARTGVDTAENELSKVQRFRCGVCRASRRCAQSMDAGGKGSFAFLSISRFFSIRAANRHANVPMILAHVYIVF